MYQALYRKWRPLAFADVIGQQPITDTLRTQMKTGRLSHAYLFTGTRGTGKTTCAKILARAVNCENPQNGDPCNECAACRGILDGSVLDVTEIDAASNNGVDNIRDLIEETRYTPAQVKKRVFIIDEVHMLSIGAFNALLKTLEEPPEHVLFILATTEIHKVPITILSRCQRFDFRRIDIDSIAKRLQQVALEEKIDLTEDAAKLIARLSDGAMRDALSMLDRAAVDGVVDAARVSETLGVLTQDHVLGFARSVAEGNLAQTIALLGEAYQDGRDLAVVFEQFLTLIRDALLVKTAKDDVSDMISPAYSVTQLQSLCEGTAAATLVAWAKLISDAISRMKLAANRRVEAELCAVRLCQISAQDYDTVSGRIDALEEKLQSGRLTVAAAPSLSMPQPQAAGRPTDVAPSAPAQEKHVPSVQKKAPETSQSEMRAWKQWPEFLEKLTGKINIGAHTNLKLSARGIVEGNALVILCEDSITATLAQADVTKRVIRELAMQLDSGIERVKVRESEEDDLRDTTGIEEVLQNAKAFDITIREE